MPDISQKSLTDHLESNTDVLSLNPDCVTIDAPRLAVVQLQRTAEHLRAPDDVDGYRLLDAVLSLHLAMTAAMSSAAFGTLGVGVLNKRDRERAVRMLHCNECKNNNDNDISNIPSRARSYSQIMVEYRRHLGIADDEFNAAQKLNELRDWIAHPKYASFTETRAEIRRICSTVAPIVCRLMECAPQNYTEKDRQDAAAAVRLMR